MSLIALLVWLLVIGILYALASYVIANLIPEPPQRILQVALVVLVGIAIVLLLLNLIGIGDVSFPKLT